MQVVIETHASGICWKLQALPNLETLAASITYFPSMEACLDDLGINAHCWKCHLPDRTVKTVGEVKVSIDRVDGRLWRDLWPDL